MQAPEGEPGMIIRTVVKILILTYGIELYIKSKIDNFVFGIFDSMVEEIERQMKEYKEGSI